MRNRQFCTPHIVNASTVKVLERLDLNERSIRESWFQDLLFKNPSLIPIDEIEPVFGPMIPVAREMPTGVGPVDVVYISASGYLTLVETKLFRNPEARREVVAQILDYATAISGWTYEDLCDAVIRSKRRLEAVSPDGSSTLAGSGADPIKALVQDHPEYDEARFVDTVSHNLARGRFLLLIVGDGIQSGVEHLAETLAGQPQLNFSLALVELALFKIDDPSDGLFVQPRVLARTKEILRAVVEVRAGLTAADVKVTVPKTIGTSQVGERHQLTEEVMFETISASLGKATVDLFRAFLAECENLGAEAEAGDSSLTLAWYEPNTERRFAFASVYAKGGFVDLRFVLHNFRKSGLDPAIGMRYVNAVAALVPGASVKANVKDGKAWPRVFVGSREITLADLLPRSAEWLAAIQTVMHETEAAGAAKDGV